MVIQRQQEFLDLFCSVHKVSLAPTGHDTRENDLYQPGFASRRRQLRLLLARRSFAVEFVKTCEWDIVGHYSGHLRKTRQIQVKEQLNKFIEEKELKDKTKQQILTGIKMLMLERYASVMTISALLLYSTSHFRNTRYQEVAGLAEILLLTASSWNTEANLEWYQTCITFYENSVPR